MQMYSNQCFWQDFHTIPFLTLTYASTLFTNYRTITHFICRIANYPVDKIIRPLNNWGLKGSSVKKVIPLISMEAIFSKTPLPPTPPPPHSLYPFVNSSLALYLPLHVLAFEIHPYPLEFSIPSLCMFLGRWGWGERCIFYRTTQYTLGVF